MRNRKYIDNRVPEDSTGHMKHMLYGGGLEAVQYPEPSPAREVVGEHLEFPNDYDRKEILWG